MTKREHEQWLAAVEANRHKWAKALPVMQRPAPKPTQTAAVNSYGR